MTLTKSDFEAFKELIKLTLQEEAETLLATKKEIKHLPTKEEFYSRMDKIMGELKAIREEHAMLSGRVYENHEPRIRKIEKKLNLQPAI